MKKILIDTIIEEFKIDRKIAESIILQGYVYVNNQKITKKNYILKNNDNIEIKKKINSYPSRSAYKLKYALDVLKIENLISNHICVDIGASHGGFTSVLLENHPEKIYAIDVAKGIFDYSLRIHNKIVLLEEKNIKHIHIQDFEYKDYFKVPWFFTCDVSFISLITVMKSLNSLITEIKRKINDNFYFYGVFLLKPQFENSKATEKGIIKDISVRDEIIKKRLKEIQELDFKIIQHFPSSIKGTRGNIEEFLFIRSI